MNDREHNICEIENSWCEQMTSLVEKDNLEDAAALYSEYVINGVEPFDNEWLFVRIGEDVC